MYPRFAATKRYDLIEVNIPANSTQTKFPIPDQPSLRNDENRDCIIQALEIFTSFDVNPSPNNVAVSTDAQILQTYLTLYIGSEESIYRVPLTQLHNMAGSVNAGGNPIPFQFEKQKFKNLMVMWDKCYFSTPVNYGAIFATFSFLIGVHYMYLPTGTMTNINKVEDQQFCNVQPKL